MQVEIRSVLGLVMAFWFHVEFAGAETIRVGSYNLEGYLELPAGGRHAKSPESKAEVRHSIRELRPDILALQEVGSASALQELQESLKAEGLDLPHSHIAAGADTNIYVAVLSRFPLVSCRSRTNLSFQLGGRRFHVSRGFIEADVQVTADRTVTLLAAHLKSRRPVPYADEQELRVEEAKLLRERIDTRLKAEPTLKLVVLGDLNDTQDSLTFKTILGRGKTRLIDTRPGERIFGLNPGNQESRTTRTVTWTHYFAVEDTYSRIDYILISPGMAQEWSPGDSYVLASPGWGLASDHRPIVAAFEMGDR